MTDETPEVPEEKATKKATKKKVARKRAVKPKSDELAAVEEAPSSPAPTEVQSRQDTGSKEIAEGNPEPSKEAKPRSDESPAHSDQPEVRRISSKPGETPVETVRSRKGEEPKRGDVSREADHESEDRPPVMSEPPSNDEGSGNKRRRRRRRKGGAGDDAEEPSQQQGQQQQSRPKLDPEIVAKKAWKIFLAEVSEEGLALISDQDARELSRRSFRLAEVFLEEASRH